MNTQDVIYQLRTKSGFSQDELAEKVFVTRQAVSRWENGETVPNTETLKILSKLFNVSINTLLGSPHQLICQCCGMPLEDEIIGRNKDGSLNEDYCKWCYADGTYTYSDMDELIEVCVRNMVNEKFTEEQARAYLNIAPNASARYLFNIRKMRAAVQYEVALPLLGVLFSPNYGQSYYELFSKGNYDHNIVFTTPFNAPTLRQMLSFDFTVKDHIFRIGYLGDFQQAKVNSLKYHAYSHLIILGYVHRFQIQKIRP